MVINNVGTVWHAGSSPLSLPFTTLVQREQFRCYKSQKGERGSERLTGCPVAQGDLQHPANAFFLLIPQGHPASLTWAIPNPLFFLLNFPFLRGFFSPGLCVWLRGLYPISFTSFFLFLPPMRQLNLSYLVNLSCSFSAFLFAVPYHHLSLPLCFPLFANSPAVVFTLPFSFSPALRPPSFGFTHPSLPFPW